jgi:hypothetical protein
MKRVIKVIGIGILGTGLVWANTAKKYDVKSAKIEYEIKGSGNIMGMVQTKTIGKKRLIFDDYGVKNLTEESKVTKEISGGKTKVNKIHTLSYMNGAVVYNVDFDAKRIMRMQNPAMAMGALFGGGDMQQTGEAMLKSMGGKKIGTDVVAGYTCEVWNLMGVKQCIYKGIPLKVQSDVMGMKSTEVAIKAEFDLSLDEDDFSLPDYPIYNMDSMMDGNEPKPIDIKKLKEMDIKDNAQAEIEAKEGAEALKGLAAGMAALAKAGVDMKSSKDLTPEQEKIMQDAMMKAMGGNGKMAAKMKKEMLDNVVQIEFAQKCFGDADTLSDVNQCVDKGNKMFHDDREHYESWTAKDKKDELQEIEDFKKAIPCIKAAQTMIEIKQCLPY